MPVKRSKAPVKIDLTGKGYFWGVWPGDPSGHALHNINGKRIFEDEFLFPWSEDVLDNEFLPEVIGGQPQPEGIATLIQEEGWTVLAFWDRSGDDRFGSRTLFVLEGTHHFLNALLISRTLFPKVFDRIEFQITPWEKALKQANLLEEIPA